MSDNIETRVKSLESWRNEQQTAIAVSEERTRHMDGRFDRVEDAIKRLDGHFSKIVWLIIASIIGAVMAFVFKGGLNGVT